MSEKDYSDGWALTITDADLVRFIERFAIVGFGFYAISPARNTFFTDLGAFLFFAGVSAVAALIIMGLQAEGRAPVETYPANWDRLRRRVYKRDGHRCANCRRIKVELHAHHIVPLSQGGTNNLSNLKTLCKDCHAKVHRHMRV